MENKRVTTSTKEREIVVTGVYERTRASIAGTVVNIGGAGSSKSYSVAQLIIEKLINERNKTIGVARKTFPALRMTAYKLIIDLLKDYGVYQTELHNKTEHTYTHGTSILQFFSLDDVEKIKSANFNYVWLEEANEFTFDDYLILMMRLRAPTVITEPNRMYLSLNPVDENGWIAQKLAKDTSVEFLHSTYHDNPFLSQEYKKIIENLINEDPNFYRIYALGEWGRLENIIYTNWDTVDNMPYDFKIERYGLDFGYENPTALVHLGITGREMFIEEILYQTHMTNADVIEFLKTIPRLDIYADSAEPQRIEEICRAGFHCYPSIKDVQIGIDTVKRYKLHITEQSVNMIKEIRGYQRKKDKNGHVLEEPIKFADHLMDSARYSVMGGKEQPREDILVYNAMELVKGMDL